MPAPARAASTPARRPAPARRPDVGAVPQASPPERRPRLRVVDDARLQAAARRRRMRVVFVVAGIGVAGMLLALAAFNAMLVSGQGRLDGLERRVAEAQSAYSTMRLRVAELEAPERIVQAAQQRLGMHLPDDVHYLTPSATLADEAGTATTAPEVRDDPGASGWASVKPYLAGRP